jgi:DNA (cytosine-5)-methyltransferase 1
VDTKLTHLDIVSGIGGFTLGFEAEGFRTVAFSEIDPEASAILAHWYPNVPNLGDITKLCRRIYDCDYDEETGEAWCPRCDEEFGDCACIGSDQFFDEIGQVDVLTGGVPCQPASAIGEMRGSNDERWLWPDAIRLVREIRPRIALFENPPSILQLERGGAFNGVVSSLAEIGYDCLWDVIPAAIVGAGHLRERLFLFALDADCHRSGLQGHTGDEQGGKERSPARRPITPEDLRGRVTGPKWWHENVSGIPVLVHGISGRLDKASCRVTGNAIVPQVAQIFVRAIRAHLNNPRKNK